MKSTLIALAFASASVTAFAGSGLDADKHNPQVSRQASTAVAPSAAQAVAPKQAAHKPVQMTQLKAGDLGYYYGAV